MNETILVVDDEQNIRTALAGILEDEGYRPVFAKDGLEALDMAKKENPDLVLLDIWMPRLDGLETLQALKEFHPLLTVVMMSGHGTIETAVKSTKLGAYDFIEKPLSLEKVLVTVKNGLDVGRLKAENDTLRTVAFKGHDMVGNTPAILQLQEQVRRVAATNASVLITGENGTGKELVARAIHHWSPRKEKPFVEINCAAIPEELIESELFGHEKGAFTGAVAQKKGKFDLADGGTIFLDEIGDMSLKTQAKVLRILQERKFERVGGTKTIEVDVRVVAATNKDLPGEIRSGTFREDLFYRLNVVPFTVPPLRERRDDIPLLVNHFLAIFAKREGQERKKVLPETVELLKGYDWPGNVRELRNIIERLVIMTPGKVITPDQVPDSIGGAAAGREGEPQRPGAPLELNSLREAREGFEREFILQKLEENGWNISRTAEVIELERSNLYRKMKSYGIDARK
ncbi:sigma-54 dependent transcriptional regulator [Geobacter hydrogenophilus]|uniref:Sigma-54-dependent Fis family transcriptional regulator n=1 Tax=Geobacter hydrogenophilus TaxID=40983 RepID=A0A9W6LDW2_9BACT|nr:sigma-54 dependent transcriptional regulator [Geobacter hydrogenophilus]MBT0892709.1 sigma-54 dependent transcriptional regulator [Geobacter hydrogenophilus]GLI40108.1 sigma-54-dependent Fis family transcriptional regulator [Geobacter hydrogenophilus]